MNAIAFDNVTLAAARPLTGLLLAAAAYLLGAVPFGVLIARGRSVDLRASGSGNIGSTNVGRVLGRRWGILCFALDVLKGFAPVLAAGLILRGGGPDPVAGEAEALDLGTQFWWLATAFAAIFGHIYSVFLGFRGGKGVATSLGVLLGFYPYFTAAAAAAFVLWVLVTWFSGYVSLGSIITAAAFPVLFATWCVLTGRELSGLWPLLTFTILMAALVIAKHRSNIARLAGGVESRVRWSLPGGKAQRQ